MNRFNATALIAFTAIMLGVGAAATTASADSFNQDHPRRAETLHRAEHERDRIRDARRQGEISGPRAHRLMAADRHIVRQEQRMARHHGGAISRAEQHRLNREENRLDRHIPG